MKFKHIMKYSNQTVNNVKAYTDVEIFLTVDACDGYTETDMFIEWTNHFACVSLVLMVVKICIVHI